MLRLLLKPREYLVQPFIHLSFTVSHISSWPENDSKQLPVTSQGGNEVSRRAMKVTLTGDFISKIEFGRTLRQFKRDQSAQTPLLFIAKYKYKLNSRASHVE